VKKMYGNIFRLDALRNVRKGKGKTLKQVSQGTGLSISYLSDLERGRTYPSIKVLLRLCDYYGKKAGDFFDWQSREVTIIADPPKQ